MMRTIDNVREMREFAAAARRTGKTIALIPTMGFLHEGHLALMREGRARADVAVASIFVNPTQFGPNEDFARYPRSFERDCELMATVPVDAVFAPAADAMYAPGAQTWVEVAELTRGLCGAARPGHFRGVTTVVAKLFNIVTPDIALFGEKDYQQLCAIRRMVRDLDFGIEIVAVPIVRESDGLAMSSRNAYLSTPGREHALALWRGLAAARARYDAGARAIPEMIGAARAVLNAARGVEVEYLEAVDAETLEPVVEAARPIVLAVAARVGGTRLIDNVRLGGESTRARGANRESARPIAARSD